MVGTIADTCCNTSRSSVIAPSCKIDNCRSGCCCSASANCITKEGATVCFLQFAASMPSLRFCFVLLLFFVQFLLTNELSSKPRVPFPGESNKWQSFTNWGRNSPKGRQHSAATPVLKRRPNGREQEVMLLYRGVRFDPDNTTWLYEPDLRTWRALKTTVWPPPSSYHTLVTLC